MSCPHCRHCVGDHAGVLLAMRKLGILAPPGAIELLVKWLEAQAGKKGLHILKPELIFGGNTWTELHIPQPPLVVKRRRGGAPPEPERIGA